MQELIALGLDRIVVVAGSRDTDPALLGQTNADFASRALPAIRGRSDEQSDRDHPQPDGGGRRDPGPASTSLAYASDRGRLVLRRPHGTGGRHRRRRNGRRAAPAHGPADRDVAGIRRAAAPRQPRLRAADPARSAQPDDGGTRCESRRRIDRPLPRRLARHPALGRAAGSHPPRPGGIRTPRGPAAARTGRRRGDGAGRRAVWSAHRVPVAIPIMSASTFSCGPGR